MWWLILLLCAWSGTSLTIHVIPHSHCDPGWLDTFETYYVKQVNKILDNSFKAVKANQNRKFIWAESSFFKRWYEHLNYEDRADFKELVGQGRWEFVGGGWSQNDEANPDYYAVMNQMTQGHDYLLKTFGVVPTIGWQIDPFGHSRVTPALFAAIGFDAMVINRINYQAKDFCKEKHCMEFNWEGADMGDKSQIFTHVLHTHYSAPKGFDWEERGISPKLTAKNVVQRAAVYIKEIEKRSLDYKTEHILVPFGDDFKFQNAQLQFEQMDYLIEIIRKEYPDITIHYSTLSDYFTAVQQNAQDNSIGFPT